MLIRMFFNWYIYRPPVDVIPMSIPTEEFDPSLAERALPVWLLVVNILNNFHLQIKPFGQGRVEAESGPVENGSAAAPTGGDTELEIVEEPVEA